MDPTDYVYYLCTAETFRPGGLYPVRWLAWDADFPLAQAHWAAVNCPINYPTWLEARALGYHYAALIEQGAVRSVAAAWNYSAANAELAAVSTHPAFRCRGYAKSVCAFVTAHILHSGQTATVSTAADNIAMQRTAESLGYQRISIAEGLRYQRMMNQHLNHAHGGV